MKSPAGVRSPAGLALVWSLLALFAPVDALSSSLFVPPGARSEATVDGIAGDRFIARRSFSSPAPLSAVLAFYRDAMRRQGWVEGEAFREGTAVFRKDDVFLQVVLEERGGGDSTGGTVLISFPVTGEEKEGLTAGEAALCPDGEVEMYQKSETEGVSQHFFTLRCGDSPPRFFGYLLPILENQGWRLPEVWEQFRPFLPENTSWHTLERDAARLQIFALPGGAQGWRYAFLTTSHKEQ